MSASLYGGVDVGGTKTAAGLVTVDGEIVVAFDEPTVPAPQIEDLITDMVGRLERSAHRRCTAVGVGLPGFLDRTGTVWTESHNLRQTAEMPLGATLERRLGRRVRLANDANAAAWGETRLGAGRGAARSVCLTVGTGLGGGVVLDGRLLDGVVEPGHLTVVNDGELCSCGRKGCLEAYVSGPALHAAARQLGFTGAPGMELEHAARLGQPEVLGALLVVGTMLGRALADLAVLFDPDCFIVGGGVAGLGDLILDPVRSAYAEHALTVPGRALARVVPAELGPQAGLIGAALLAAPG